MKKIISLLVVLAMLMAIAPAVFADDDYGYLDNVKELVLGENEAVYVAETETSLAKPAYFVWTATDSGTLTIDFSDEDEFNVWCSISQLRDGNPIEGLYITEHGGTASLEVKTGDEIIMQVEEYDYHDATLHFTATLTVGAEDEVAGSGTEADPWIITDLSAPITGSFTSEEDGDHYYNYVATEDGTISWGPWSGCALFITLNGSHVDADFVDVKAGDVLMVNAWALYGVGEYSVTLTFEAAGNEGGNEGGEGGEDAEGLTLGDNHFDIPDMGSVSDVFVATEDGTLIILVTEMVVFDPDSGEYVEVDPATQLSRMGYYDLLVNEEEANSHVFTLEVVAGQEVVVALSAMGNGAQATVNLAMEAAEGGESGNDTPASGTVDVTADSPIIFDLVLEADDTVTIELSSTTGWEVHIGNASGEVDNRYWSDSDASPIVENLAAGAYTVTIYGYDEVDWIYVDATITYAITVGTAEPGCAHEYTYTEAEYYEDGFTFDLLLICADCGEVLDRFAPGEHEENPILVEFQFDEATNTAFATVTVPAGKTLWYGANGIGGMMLTINGVEYGVLQGMGPWMPVVFTLTNDTAEDAAFELLLAYPLGSSENPDDMIVNESFELTLPENNNGYVFEWIATADGTITLVVEGSNWLYFVNNYGNPDSWDDDSYGDYFFDFYGDSNTYTFTVKAGDQVQFNFGTQDADWNTPAETLTITATFATEGGQEPEEPSNELVLGDNAMADGEYTFTATQTGTLYFCIDALAYKYGDISDIRNYVGEDVVLYVNGELFATNYYGFLEVTEGDVITFKWESTGYYSYTGNLNLSYENNNPVPGTEQCPIELEFADCPATTPEIAPGQAIWYELSQEFYDAALTIIGKDAFVMYSYYSYDEWDWVNVTVYADENGVIYLSPVPSMNIQIGNAGAEAAVFQIEAFIPEGTAGNPADLVLGENVAEIEVNRPDMFYFDWTAPSDGVLTITVSGDNWMYYLVNPNTYEMSDNYFFYNDPVVNTIQWPVVAGDTIIVAVCTCVDWNNVDWSDPNAGQMPAGTIYVTASFEGEEVPCTHENLVHVEAVEPGCFSEGNIEHWYCADCDTVWSDEALTMITNHKSVILPATHKNIVHVEAVAPTCTENGNIEYWYCEDCLTVWIDEDMMQISNMKSVVDPATGHTYVDGECHCGAKDELPPTGDMITVFCALIAASSMGLAILPKKKEN